ncbi:MAG: Adaptor for signal transduction [Chrysothrix sp. TS-e1954]|nr:MAG: Adaptor for signal transduction [Chrysothrix sp. TS-e1954]
MAYENSYQHESDADDEFERSSVMSPTLPPEHDYESSPTDSGEPSAQHTPTTFTHSTATAVSPRGLVTQWTPEQCADFVGSLGLDKYGDAIIEEEIDGKALIALQHADLKDMSVASVGHRLTILKGVYEVKLKQNIPIDPDHYVPLSADANAPDAHATQDDIARIINQIKLRDERIMTAEAELRQIREDMDRILEEQRKQRDIYKPLPPPGPRPNTDTASPLPPSLTHGNQGAYSERKNGFFLNDKPSKRTILTGNAPKLPSPTTHKTPSLDPSAAALAASNHLTASMSSGSQASPHLSNQPSPTSPQYNQPPMSRQTTATQLPSNATFHPSNTYQNGTSTSSEPPTASTSTSSRRAGTSSSTSTPTEDPTGFMKSFRVSMEEPCHKVLPVALQKYHIQDDWRQYSLYIVYGDQERCLGLDERPLILFKQLANEGKKPMFMLRKHAAPQDGFAHTRVEGGSTGTGTGGTSGNSSGGGGSYGPGNTGGSGSSSAGGQGGGPYGGQSGGPYGAQGGGPYGASGGAGASGGGRQSYASAVQLPGGVL